MFDKKEIENHRFSDQNSKGVAKSEMVPYFFSDSSAKDIQPHPIPKLDLLDKLVEISLFKGINFEKTLFVGVQHILETTASLFESLIRLGAKPERMFFSGKCYSTCPAVAKAVSNLGIQLISDYFPTQLGGYQISCLKAARELWNRVCKYLSCYKDVETIIIVDDGARCFETIPGYLCFDYKIAGIEQTRGGLYSPHLNGIIFPLIETATSASKRLIESTFISQAIINRLEAFLSREISDKNTIFGVVGTGAIGDAVLSSLLAQGFKTVIYDTVRMTPYSIIKRKNLFIARTLESLVEISDCIIGCTGVDITEHFDFTKLNCCKKTMISVSSEDKEFRSLLKKLASLGVKLGEKPMDIFNTIVYQGENGIELDILNGGYPFNFDQRPGNVPIHDIELTQGLMLIGCMQAQQIATKPEGGLLDCGRRYMLSPSLQKFVVCHWHKDNAKERYPAKLFEEHFKSLVWIKTQSGDREINNNFENLFPDIPLEFVAQKGFFGLRN